MNIIIASLSVIGSENFTIAIVGYLIVFTALVTLVVVFTNLPKLISRELRNRLLKRSDEVEKEVVVSEISGEENAAIAMAIYLYFNEMHDEESNVITIRKVSKTYSPWSSKIYGLNTIDRKPWQ